MHWDRSTGVRDETTSSRMLNYFAGSCVSIRHWSPRSHLYLCRTAASRFRSIPSVGGSSRRFVPDVCGESTISNQRRVRFKGPPTFVTVGGALLQNFEVFTDEVTSFNSPTAIEGDMGYENRSLMEWYVQVGAKIPRVTCHFASGDVLAPASSDRNLRQRHSNCEHHQSRVHELSPRHRRAYADTGRCIWKRLQHSIW